MPLARKLLLECDVVLYDAVMHHDELARPVRVRVLLGRPAVRSPARVPDAYVREQLLALDGRLQVTELPDATPDAYLSVLLEEGYARGVVTPVLEPLQTLDQYRYRVLPAYVTDYSAHKSKILRSFL